MYASPQQIDLRVEKAAAFLQRAAADGQLFDLVFIDADKKGSAGYVSALAGLGGARALLSDGALVLVDNTLWKGLVVAIGEKSLNEADQLLENERTVAIAKSIHEFSVFCTKQECLSSVLLPMRDGVTALVYSNKNSNKNT